MIYKLVLGDWSKESHGISKNILVDCNCNSVTDIQNAYKASCKKLGVQFNDDEDYTGKHLPFYDPHLIWTTYCEGDMSKTAYDILDKAGCLNRIDVKENDKSLYDIDTLEECASVIMNFIALSMPEGFAYKIIQENYPCINGYWNNNLNVQFGYGLFDD